MGIPRNFPTGTESALLVRTRNIVGRQTVQWIDGPKKTGDDGTGSDDRGMKSAGDKIIVERGTPQLNIQELGQKQQLTLHEHETQEALSEYEREQQHEEGEAKPASGSENLEGPALPALRKLTITYEESKTPHRCGGRRIALFLAGDRGRRGKRRGGCVGVRRRGPDGYAGDAGYTGTEKSAAGDGIAEMGQMAEGRGD